MYECRHTSRVVNECIYVAQAAKIMYGMFVTDYGVRHDDGYASPPEKTFNPNNVINFDESLGYTVHWYFICSIFKLLHTHLPY